MGIKFVSYFVPLFLCVDMLFRIFFFCFLIMSTQCSTQAHTNLQLFDKQQIREIDWNHWNGCTLSNILYRIASHPRDFLVHQTYRQQHRSTSTNYRTIQLKACYLFLFVASTPAPIFFSLVLLRILFRNMKASLYFLIYSGILLIACILFWFSFRIFPYAFSDRCCQSMGRNLDVCSNKTISFFARERKE